jgi:hypothetical protein
VSKRLDWAASQFERATHENERIVVHASGDFGYVVQRERIRFVARGAREEATREYRVTLVCRHGAEGWRIVHRHADTELQKQPVTYSPARYPRAAELAVAREPRTRSWLIHMGGLARPVEPWR